VFAGISPREDYASTHGATRGPEACSIASASPLVGPATPAHPERLLKQNIREKG